MRRQRISWTFMVISILCALYGGYFAIRKYNEDKTFFIASLVICIAGSILFIICLITHLTGSKRQERVKKEEDIIEEKPVEEEKKEEPKKVSPPKRDYEYVPRSSSHRESIYDDYSSGYVKQVGYGPVLEISGNRIRDMRNNTYYRIQDNYVYQDGGGVLFEIANNKIRSVYGGYLFEISGSSIYKTYGGFFASISGNYITKYDSSIKYETTCSLNKKQLLVIAALLFE